MSDLMDRAVRMRRETLPSYRHRVSQEQYILLTCDADVAISAAEIGNATTVDRLLDRLTKVFAKLDERAGAA
jgi:hypothetical protein